MATIDTKQFNANVVEAARFVIDRLGTAEIALVLGSGLGAFAEEFHSSKSLPYAEIPNMPTPTVSGHSGTLHVGTLRTEGPDGAVESKGVLCFAGRIHAYEGGPDYEMTFSARLAAEMGCRVFIATNAAGGAVKGMEPGHVMLIRDHINYTRRNPLADVANDETRCLPRNAALAGAYSERLAKLSAEAAEPLDMTLYEGVYARYCGPSYETASEIQAGLAFGAGSFGMSTVPETTFAAALQSCKGRKMEVAAFSLCTNMAAGLSDEVLTHDGVKDVASVAGPRFVRFMRALLFRISSEGFPPAAPEVPRSTAPRTSVLPQPQPTAAPEEEVAAAAAHIREAAAAAALSAPAVALAVQQEVQAGLLKGLQGRVELRLSAVPHMPVVSNSAADGVLVVGKSASGVSVFCLTNVAAEGYLCEEANFLVRVLAKLGVGSLATVFTAAAFDESLTGTAVLVNDGEEWGCVHAVPDSAPLRQFATEEAVFNRTAAVAKGDVKQASVMSYMGPTYPTPAEFGIARISGADLATISSLPLVFAARAAGLGAAAVAAVSQALPDFAAVPSAADVYAQAATLALNLIPDLACDPATVEPTSLPRGKREFSYAYAPPIAHCDYEEVHEAAAFVKAATKADSSTGVLIYAPLEDVLSDVVEGLSSVEDIPHAPAGFRLLSGKKDGKHVFAVVQRHYLSSGVPFCDVTFGIYLLSVLSSKVVMVNEFCDVAGSFEGKVITLRDHVNISNRNPLYGHNDERWGDRFFDVASMYDAKLRAKVTSDGKVEAVVAGFVPGPIYHSALLRRFLEKNVCDVVTTGAIPEALVAAHIAKSTGTKAVTIGPVVCTLAEAKAARMGSCLKGRTAAALALALSDD